MHKISKSKKIIFIISFFLIIIFFIIIIDFFVGRLGKNHKNAAGGIVFYTNNSVKVIDHSHGNNIDIKLLLSPVCVYKNFPNQKSIYKINSFGTRGDEIKLDKVSNRIRIVFIGGSSIFGWRIYDEQKTIPSLIQKKDKKIEVINAGVIGYNSTQELGLFITDIIELKPDILICYNLWNDVFFSLQAGDDYLGVNNIYNGIEWLLEEKIDFEKKVFTGLMLFSKALFFKTNIGKVKKLHYEDQLLTQELERVDKEFNTDFNDLRIKESLKLYKKNMRIISNITKVEGIEFLVVLQPEINTKRNQTKAEWDCQQLPFSNYLKHFSPIFKCAVIDVEKYFKKENIDYININAEEEFVGSRDTLFMDFIHTNEKGNDIIAEIIYDYLKQSLE